MEIKNMDLPTRRRLIQLACVAAWSDMNLADVEKEVVLNLARELELGEDDTQRVKSWLANGPPDFDPYDIPLAHRQAFLEAFTQVIAADGRIDPEESEAIRLIRELVS
ncbi:MAG: TerB family tellurite resistance protein [Myxococcales bacterium]|nr:TerB family tellurite resistance protein [Myxococcales bacterium]MCB9732492.1 TerB family tellurite resistance protein [Deltaproteobacteria bacterium]